MVTVHAVLKREGKEVREQVEIMELARFEDYLNSLQERGESQNLLYFYGEGTWAFDATRMRGNGVYLYQTARAVLDTEALPGGVVNHVLHIRFRNWEDGAELYKAIRSGTKKLHIAY